MAGKELTLVVYDRSFPREDWTYDVDEAGLDAAVAALAEEFQRFDIGLKLEREENIVLKISGYGDLLNSVRIRSPRDGFSSLCLSQVIGASQEADFIADIQKALNRVAFAPETIQPEDANRVVCHNCGCGC